MTAIKSFYKSQYIVIQEIERRDATKPMKEYKGIPEKESIRKILEVADPLEKAVILIRVSSDLSVTEICNLKLFEFENGYERFEENTVDSDYGAMILDGIKTLAHIGVCSELSWPYDISQNYKLFHRIF